jgi:hypothetical protein
MRGFSRSRIASVQALQRKFLEKDGSASDAVERQIINIGCGYDTFVFNLFAEAEGLAPFKYIEMDLKEVVEKKVKFIQESKDLQASFRGQTLGFKKKSKLTSERYGLAAVDLTDLLQLEYELGSLGVDPR